MQANELVEAWRDTIGDRERSWVLFENGTCVILMEPEADLVAQATTMLREWGPVHAASSSADLGVITLDNGRGWMVTCHHADIVTFVGSDEVSPEVPDVVIGLIGRSKRVQDAAELRVLHVEDKRHV